MIKSAAQDIAAFKDIILNAGFLGYKIYADYVSNQSEETNSFYIGDNTAFMLSGTNLTLCGKPSAEHLEEILMFCNFCRVTSIESQIEGLPMKVDKVLHIMEYTGKGGVSHPDIVKNQEIYSFIKFCCNNFHNINFDIVYSNFIRKVNRKVSDIYFIKENGKIVSGAISTNYGEDSVYITFVATDKEYRGQGFAAKVIGHIINDHKSKKIILKCEDSLLPFYQKLGFEKIEIVKLYKE